MVRVKLPLAVPLCGMAAIDAADRRRNPSHRLVLEETRILSYARTLSISILLGDDWSIGKKEIGEIVVCY